MIVLFYEALKNCLETQFPPNSGIKLIDYDYSQYDAQGDKPNYAAQAVYIGVSPFEVQHRPDGVIYIEGFEFSLTFVQHTLLDNDKRVLDAGLRHWGKVMDLVTHLNRRMFRLADVPSLGITLGDASDKALTNSMMLTSISPERRLSNNLITRINFKTNLLCYEIMPNFVVRNPTILANVVIDNELLGNYSIMADIKLPLSTRKHNSLLLCKKIHQEYKARFDKQGKRPDVIYDELATMFFITAGTVRNKRLEWEQLPEHIKQLVN